VQKSSMVFNFVTIKMYEAKINCLSGWQPVAC
jgi:hypothetical protein